MRSNLPNLTDDPAEAPRRGVELLLDFLEANGFEYVFGNPGTFEQGFMEALSRRPALSYVLALHESVAVAMADGYARASGRPAFVNVHVSAGLSNGLSQIYNAMVHRSPLLVSAGQAESHLLLEEPLLAADTVSLARHFTKWAWELRQATDLPIALRRALKIAVTAPSGPVFLSLPIDLVDLPSSREDAPAQELPRMYGRSAEPAGVEAAAALVAGAVNPVILCGDDVARVGATRELVELAEMLGATVYALAQCEISFPNDHPQFVRTLNPSARATRERLADADVIVAVGAPLFQQLLSPGIAVLPKTASIVQITESDWEASKNISARVALIGNLASSLIALRIALNGAMTPEAKARAVKRREQAHKEKGDRERRLTERIRASEAGDNIDELRLAATLRSVMPEQFSVVEEAPSASGALQQAFKFSGSKELFGNRGAALGWGMPGALGVQLALPERTVIAVIGDGAANYSIQALWTSAHYHLPVKFVICNNREYGILRTNLAEWLPGADLASVPGMDLRAPDIDFVSLAEGYGVHAARVDAPGELVDALAAMLSEPGPALLEVMISGSHR
jgi:benzoylformate decarboxylase